MSKFAVIQIEEPIDEEQEAKCIQIFSIKQEAKDFVKNIKKQYHENPSERLNYISKFVEELNVPEVDEEGWKIYLRKFGLNYVHPKNFKDKLFNYLADNHSVKLDEYFPPELYLDHSYLIVVEIND